MLRMDKFITNHVQISEYLFSRMKIGSINLYVAPIYKRTLNHVIVLFLLERKEFEGYLEM